jgi:hypothetical protein
MKTDLKHYAHFAKEIEQAIALANREVIHQRLPALNAAKILPFAVLVARIRTRYLELAFGLAEKSKGEVYQDSDLADLKRWRETYDEARLAFEALMHAIERGYIALES